MVSILLKHFYFKIQGMEDSSDCYSWLPDTHSDNTDSTEDDSEHNGDGKKTEDIHLTNVITLCFVFSYKVRFKIKTYILIRTWTQRLQSRKLVGKRWGGRWTCARNLASTVLRQTRHGGRLWVGGARSTSRRTILKS